MQTSDKIALSALAVSVVSIIVTVTTVLNRGTYDLNSVKEVLGNPSVPSGLYAQVDVAKRDVLAAKTLAESNKDISNEARRLALLAEKTAVISQKDAQEALSKVAHAENLASTASEISENANTHANKPSETAQSAFVNSVPIGTVLAWIPTDKMPNPPKGWKVCDGTNGTPNLEGRFLVGVRHLNKTKKIGGRRDIPLQASHNHGRATTSVNSNRITYSRGDNNNGVWFNHSHGIRSEGTHNHGGENRPPYYTVIYIIKTS